jgi:hypothetical protein
VNTNRPPRGIEHLSARVETSVCCFCLKEISKAADSIRSA